MIKTGLRYAYLYFRGVIFLLLIVQSVTGYCSSGLPASAADSLLQNGYDLYKKGKRDTALIFATFRRAADAGSDQAESNLLYLTMKHDSLSYIDAFRKMKQAYENGNKAVSFNLALMYYRGLGVNENPEEAERLMKEFSAIPLGKKYVKSWLDAKRDVKSVFWLIYGGASGCMLTGYNVAAPQLYRKAIVYHDECRYKESIAIFRKYALGGDVNSLCNLGYYYWYGLGVDVDRKKSFEYYKKAAAGNRFDFAKFTLATLYATGSGVRFNAELAENTYNMFYGSEKERFSANWEKTLKYKYVYLTFCGYDHVSITEHRPQKR